VKGELDVTDQQKVTDYFHRLSGLLLTMEVTDRRGVRVSLEEGTEKAIQMFLDVKSAFRKVMLAGNGGSAAIVSHVQNDLCKAVGMRAMVFNEPPLLTALANDHGYGCVFQRPIELWAEPGDVLFTVSSSGKSESILRAIQAAVDKQCQVITLSGFSPDNASRRMGDLNFYLRSDVYGYVETAHMALAHFLTTRLSACSNAP
jgi:D-sedoheptulose 7-phosphate isomerase